MGQVIFMNFIETITLISPKIFVFYSFSTYSFANRYTYTYSINQINLYFLFRILRNSRGDTIIPVKLHFQHFLMVYRRISNKRRKPILVSYKNEEYSSQCTICSKNTISLCASWTMKNRTTFSLHIDFFSMLSIKSTFECIHLYVVTNEPTK